MSAERKQFTVGRRTILKWAFLGAAALAGPDLIYRNVVAPIEQTNENNRRYRIYADLTKKAEAIYPNIPLLDNSILGKSADEISKVQQKSVVVGYDEARNPILLNFLEGEDLINALGYTNEILDEPMSSFSGLRNKDGTLGPLKPDGTKWTLRERILYRPDIYNEYVRIRVNNKNDQKRREWAAAQLPSKKTKYIPDGTRDNLELLILFSPAIIGAVRFVARKIHEAAERQKSEAWYESWEETFKRHEERRWQEYQQQRQQDSKEEYGRQVAAEPTALFQALGVDLESLRQKPTEERRQRVSEIRKGIALILKDGKHDNLWAALNNQLDQIDPKFDKKFDDQKETTEPQSKDKGDTGTSNNTGIVKNQD